MVSPIVPLTYYALLILAASLLGGMLPKWLRLTHGRMQKAVSLVAGMMFAVGMLHMLPHALAAQSAAARATEATAVDPIAAPRAVMLWTMLGWLTMFLIQRFFAFHHHDFESDRAGRLHEHDAHCDHDHPHRHDLTWGGAALGLGLHSLLEGIALAASVWHGHAGSPLAGLGACLAVLFHKPFDAMTIAMLMARSGRSLQWQLGVNALFAGAIPLGMALFSLGLANSPEQASSVLLGPALGFSAGTFLCISLSDLLPELQFHDHDRVALSIALAIGLALGVAVGQLESLIHRHGPPAAVGSGEPGRLIAEGAEIAEELRLVSNQRWFCRERSTWSAPAS